MFTARQTLLCSLLAASALAAQPVMAANDAMIQLLKVLKDKGTLDKDTYEALVNAAKADDEHVQFTEDSVKQAQKESPKIDTKEKLKISSPDGDFEWQLVGRVQGDYNFVESDRNPMGSGAQLRRARLGMQGKMWGNWLYKFEWDFPSNQAKDAFVGYKGDNWWLKAGQQNLPFGLVTLSSDNYTLFTERPLLGEKLQDEYEMGISAFMHGDKLWTLQAGLFAGPWDFRPGNNSAQSQSTNCSATAGCSEQINVAVRGTFNPYMRGPSKLLHLGGAFWYRDPQDTALNVQAKAGRFDVGPNVLDLNNYITRPVGTTFRTTVDRIYAENVEALGIWDRFHVQGEYTHWLVDRKAALPDVDLNGWYVEAGYFLTPDSMNFKPEDGAWSGVKPHAAVGKGGWGAWQIAARYDTLDLNDRNAGVVGGEEESFSAGVNWYVNNNMRFMADYIKVLNIATRGSVNTARFNGDEPSAFVVRGQVNW